MYLYIYGRVSPQVNNVGAMAEALSVVVDFSLLSTCDLGHFHKPMQLKSASFHTLLSLCFHIILITLSKT